MGHHLSWYNFIPGYSELFDFLQRHFLKTVVFNNGVMPNNPTFDTVHHVFAAVLVLIFLASISVSLKRKISDHGKSLIPSKTFNIGVLIEIIIELLLGVMKDIIGKNYKKHAPLVGSLALFILFSNFLGLIPGFIPPTDNLNTTLACGLIVFVYFNYHGLKTHGISHFTHLANPIGEWWGWFLSPLLFPVELASLIIRPLSLAIRLAGNMTGDHKVVLTFAGVMPILVPLPFLLLGFMVSIIQAVVFCLLTCVYISLHTQDSH
jgi:F-type H+-transporting ATPase subunit a